MILLNPIEARVLGALLEKETTTPEYYPLSLNALLAASNQKSSRDPVLSLTEEEIRGALCSLEDADLVSTSHDTRVPRYENRARTVFNLRRDETAVLCLLLLRGPQTVGELRSRADRLFTFDDLEATLSALSRMTEREVPLVALLPRQPGSKEARYAHLLSGPISGQLSGQLSGQPSGQLSGRISDQLSGQISDPGNPAAAFAHLPSDTSAVRLDRLEAELAELRARVDLLSPTKPEKTG